MSKWREYAFNYALLLFCLLSIAITPAHADHASLSFADGGSGPIITLPAATMPQGKLAVSLSCEYIRSDRFSDAELARLAGRHIHAHSADWTLVKSLGVDYGLADNLLLSVQAPRVHRENVRSGSHAHVGGVVLNGVDELGDSTGFGDIGILGKYRFWKKAFHQAALLAGVKTPTGRTHVRKDGARLETEHQPGSGSWDGLFGFAASTKAGPVSLDANALYALVTEGSQNTDLGDKANYNFAMSYRIDGESDNRQAFDLVLELNGEWSDQKKQAGRLDENSGGNTIYLTPGFRYAPDAKWSAHFAAGVPVVSNLGRGHSETDFRITLGIARSF